MRPEDQADGHEYIGRKTIKFHKTISISNQNPPPRIHLLDFTGTLEGTSQRFRSMNLVFTVMKPLPGAYLHRCLRGWVVGSGRCMRMCWQGPPGALRSLGCVHLLLHGRRHFLPIVLQTDATVSWLKSQYIPWEWKKPRTMRCGC